MCDAVRISESVILADVRVMTRGNSSQVGVVQVMRKACHDKVKYIRILHSHVVTYREALQLSHSIHAYKFPCFQHFDHMLIGP